MRFKIPGTSDWLVCERGDGERLESLTARGRPYVSQRNGERVFDSGFVRMEERFTSRGLQRHVVAPSGSWTEEYTLDAGGLLTSVDGAAIRRDDRYRIVACGDWLYGYSNDGLSIVDGPSGTHRITRAAKGRPVRLDAAEIPYDPQGRRADIAALPARFHRDALGRLWTITAPDGRVLTTYLWDGFACLARIDGRVGHPLAAVFSLDPSRTPIRVILRERVIRVPRDAFGEGLLAHEGVPGLHGGSNHGGFTHYRSRILDPRVGSYDRLDPCDGGADDPRRRGGYRGTLPVEKAASGPYAACQYDPVSYVDPTGENTGMTLLLLLSDLTWSLQHNLAGWLGLDFTLNWWIDFFSIVMLPRFFEFEDFHSDRTGRFGTRRGGVFSGNRVFTYQHQIFGNAASFDDLRQTQLFDPRGRFEPALYGSLLRADPGDAPAFLLQGNLDAQAFIPWRWTRAGGPAESIAPGLPAPYFPSGGLHFDSTLAALLGPRDCKLTELRPSDDRPVVASIAQSTAFVDFPSTVTGLSAGSRALLTDGGTAVDIETVVSVTPQGGGSRVRLTDPTTTIAASGIRLRGLSAPDPDETLTPIGPGGRLDMAGSTGNYGVNDALVLSQGGVDVGAALVRSLEAQLVIDGPLPAPPAAALPLTVRTLIEGFGGNAVLAGNILSRTGTDPLPGIGAPVVIRGAGQARGTVVVAAPNADERQLDRSAADLAPLGPAVTWNPLAGPGPLGQAAAVDAAATLTYNPSAVRTAPATGVVQLTGTGYDAVRVVSALNYDAIVLGTALPGNTANSYQVSRFVPQAPDVTDGTLGALAGLSVPPGLTLPGLALQLRTLNAPSIAPGTNIGTVTLNGATAILTPPIPGAPNPSDVVVLQDTTSRELELAVVSEIRATIRLDRALATPGPTLRLVQLGPTGFTYNATRNADTELTVLPTANGALDVQMPRFRAGEIVQVNGLLYRVSAVNGTTLTLEDGLGVLPAGPLTVLRMVPINPNPLATGTPWLGDTGTQSGTDYTFRVWAPNATAAAGAVGIVSRDPADRRNDVTRAAFITATPTVQIRFTAAPSGVGPTVTIHTPNFDGSTPFYAPSFSQSGADLTLQNLVPGPLPGGNNLIVAIPYEATNITANGRLTPGNVLCPNDPENWEFDRRQSLAEHELTHTCQSATWGPLYMGYLPIFVLEGASELFTDVELPEFSRFVDGELILGEGQTRLRIPDLGGVDFSEGKRVQISSDRFNPVTASLGAAGENNTFLLIAPVSLSLSAGPVSVRRQVGSNGWTLLRDVVYNILHILTLGGVTNLVAGGIWGGLIFSIGKLWFVMSRRLFGGGHEYPATVADDKRTVTMTTAEGRVAVQGFNEIILRSSSGSRVRKVESISAEALILKEDAEVAGEVRVVPYGTNDISDWHDYYDAEVPDASRPAAIRVQPRSSGSRLGLHPFDRVTIAHGTRTFRTNVTAVPGNDIVELEQAPTSTPLRIAKVDENDPIGSADSRHLAEMGVGWMRWLFDPYAQFQFRLNPDRSSWKDIVARIARYAFSSHSWSAAVPGSLFFRNLFSQPNNGHRTSFEQDASSESGNLYSPLSVLRGSFQKAGAFATFNATVGDVGRFWHVPLHDVTNAAGNRVPSVVMDVNLRDSPGTHLRPGQTPWVRILPTPTASPSGALNPNDNGEPNTGVTPSDPNPGRFLPDILTDKNAAGNPQVTSRANPASFGPSELAFIPTSAALNQTVGCYVSFTRPGTHRLTVQDGLQSNWKGRDAQESGAQTLWFDVVVTDVTVTAMGRDVATTDPPPTINLVLLQRAELGVSPNQNRLYAATVTRPGNVLNTEGLTLVAGATAGTDTVEISRFYACTNGVFSDAVLSQHAMHLPADLHIPVRIFHVAVVSTLPLLDGPEPAATTVSVRNPGQPGFLLVPVAADAPPIVTVIYPGGGTPGIRDPQIAFDSPTPSDTARAFLGAAGVIFRIPFTDPPEETADLTLSVPVRSGTQVAQLRATVQLVPHFRILHAVGTYRVQRGTGIDLMLEGGLTPANPQCSGDGVANIAPGTAGFRIDFASTASLGTRTVTVADAAAPARTARRSIEVIA